MFQKFSNCCSKIIQMSNQGIDKIEHSFTIVHDANPKRFCSSYQNLIKTFRHEIKTMHHLLVFVHDATVQTLPNFCLGLLHTSKLRIKNETHLHCTASNTCRKLKQLLPKHVSIDVVKLLSEHNVSIKARDSLSERNWKILIILN